MTSVDVEQTALIERIVRVVLQRIDHQQHGSTSAASGSPCEGSTLQISDEVVTTQVLDRRLDGIRRLVLTDGAIVTPSVWDETRQRGIAVEFAREQTSTSDPIHIRVILVSADSSPLFRQTLAKIGQLAGATVHPFQADENVLLHELQMFNTGKHQKVVWFSEQPAVVVHRANRVAWLKAAWVVDSQSVRDARQSLEANLFVIQPSRHSMNELRQFIESIKSP